MNVRIIKDQWHGIKEWKPSYELQVLVGPLKTGTVFRGTGEPCVANPLDNPFEKHRVERAVRNSIAVSVLAHIVERQNKQDAESA